MGTRWVVPLCMAMFARTSSAELTGYNIDLGPNLGSSGTPFDTFGAAAGQIGYWNALNPGADQEPMLDINGADYGATFSSAGGHAALKFNNTSTSGNFQRLFDDFQDTDAAAGDITITIDGLEPADYLVFTYALAPDGVSYKTNVNVLQSTSGSQIVGGQFSAAFVLGVTHAMHTATVDVDQQLTITISTASHYASVNGLQLVPLVELAGAFGQANGDQFGRAIASIGDIDGDEYDDFIVGAPYHDGVGSNAGKIYIYSGASGDVIQSIDGEAAGDQFGYAIARAGDVNADGALDFLVSAPFSNQANNDAGKVYVFSTADFSILYEKVGSNANDRFGMALAGGIDINNDGYDDFLIGAPESNSKNGQLFVYSGATGAKLKIIKGKTDDKLGWAIAPLPKTNGDDFADFAVSSPLNDDAGSNAGRITVYSGKDFSVRYTIEGNNPGDQFGYSLACAGRANSDSRDDLIVGSPYYDTPGKSSRGRAELFSGSNGALIWSKTGPAAGDRLGWAVAGVGDVNADGYDDVATSAAYHDGAGTDAGRVHIRSGINGLTIAAIDGQAAGDRFAWSLAGLEKPAGNGTNDVLAGAPHHDINGPSSGKIYRISLIDAAQAPSPENNNGGAGGAGGGLAPVKQEIAPVDFTGGSAGPDAGVPAANECCAGDLNLDGAIDEADLLALLGFWGACDDCPEDLNGDDLVDAFDVMLLIDLWGSMGAGMGAGTGGCQ